jgi:hypothetical protein
MTATLTALVEAVRAEMAGISGVVAQGGATLTEGIVDIPTIQITPESGEGAYHSRTDRNTFGKGLALRQWVINVDVYARQRSHIAEDMAAVTTQADAVIARLDAKATSPSFGVSGVHTWHYTWQRVVFTYGSTEARYAGIRFVLTFLCR